MKMNLFYRVMRGLIKPFFMLRYRIKYIGRENVPQDGAYILASNHRESIDPIFIGIGLKRQVYFMAKAELFEKKFVAKILSKLGAFPVDRGKGDQGAIRHFEEILEDGNLMGIFIEGTRSKTDEFLRPKNGVSLIAYDTGKPVIPICITRIGGKRIVHFDKALTVEELGMTTGGAREFRIASRTIMDHIKAMRAEDKPEDTVEPKPEDKVEDKPDED